MMRNLLITLTLFFLLFMDMVVYSDELPLAIKTSKENSGLVSKDLCFDTKDKLEINFATNNGKLVIRRIDKLLYTDTNGDGVVDKKDNGVANKSIIKIPVKIGSENVEYPIKFSYRGKNYVNVRGFLFLSTSFAIEAERPIKKNTSGK